MEFESFFQTLKTKKSAKNDVLFCGSFVPSEDKIDITWIPTLICNYKCRYCKTYQNLPENYASKQNIDRTAEFIKDIRRTKKNIILEGGEVTTHPDFFYMIDKLEFCSRITVFTNLGCRQNTISKLAERKCYIASSYHPDIESSDSYIEKLKYILKIGGNIKYINIMIMSQHFNDADKVLLFCKENRIVYRLVPLRGENESKLLVWAIRNSSRDAKKIHMLYGDMKMKSFSREELFLFDKSDFYGYKCYSGVSSIIIDHHGDVFCCDMDKRCGNKLCTVNDKFTIDIPRICPYHKKCTCDINVPKMI